MKRYSQITWKYLKNQRKRTILTLFGVMLSLALISSIGTLLFSLHANQVKEVIQRNGDYHFGYVETGSDLADRLKSHAKVDQLSIVHKQAEIPLADKVNLQLQGMNPEAMKAMPITLKEGRLPKKENEVMVEKWALEKMKSEPGIGDSLDLKVGEEKQTYTLVGILENGVESQYSGQGQAATFLSSVPTDAKLDLYVKLKPDVPIRESLPEFEKMATEGELISNKELLRLLGEGSDQSDTKAMVTIGGILVGLVMIATVAVIYNAFHISVLERIKQFGVLRSIGATPKQIKNIVLREALLLCIVGIPLGVLLGTFALRGVFVLFPSEFLIGAEDIVILPQVVLISATVGLIAVFASAFLPARMASKVSPLDAIHNRGSMKKEKVKRGRGWFDRWFSIESAMAIKNLSRNKKRYRITVFSLMISVVLFMAFGSFVDMVLQVEPPENEDRHVDFHLYYMEEDNQTKAEEYVEHVRSIKGIDKAMPNYETIFPVQAIIPKSKMVPEYRDAFPSFSIQHENQVYSAISAMIQGYDEQRLEDAKRYIKTGTINVREMDEENGVLVMVSNRGRSDKDNKRIEVDAANLQPGDMLSIDVNNWSAETEKFPKDIVKVKVVAVLDRSPYGEKPYVDGGMQIITTKNTLEKMAKQIDPKKYKERYGNKFSGLRIYGMDIKLKPDANREYVHSELDAMVEKDSSLAWVDRADSKQKEQQLKMQFKVLVYGFIAVITLIGALNIINTVSTNMILRKREFATMKALGMTMEQLKKMVLVEGSLYGFAGAVYGIILGLPLSYLLYLQFTDIIQFGWSIPWMNMAIAFAGAILIGLVSTLLPLRRIQSESVIDDIRMEG